MMIRRPLPFLVPSPVALAALALVALTLAGCATTPEHVAPERAAAELADTRARPPAATTAKLRLGLPELKLVPRPKPPVQGLSQESLFSLLVADLAGRSGDAKTSLTYYLDLARTTSDPRIAKRATQLALHVGDRAAALEASRRWSELAPDSRDAHAVLARLWLRRGEPERARPQLQRVIELTEGGTVAGLHEVAALVSNAEQPEAALAAMRAIAAQHPDVAVVHYAVGDLAARTGKPERALAAVERALQLDPDSTQALLLRARIDLDQGRSQRAFEQLRQAYRRRPGDRDLALGYMQLLIEAGRVREAKAEMQDIHERFGQDPFAVEALARLAMQAEIWDYATLYLERLVAMNAHTSMARYFLGRIAQQQGDCQRALRQYVKVGGGEYRFDAGLRSAICMAEIGRIDEARFHLERMQARYDAADAAALIAIAQAQVEREAGRIEHALEILGNALERQPDHIDLRYTRALTAADADRFELARRDLKRILEQDPNNSRVLNALGYMLADRGLELEHARALIERALAQQPNDAAMLDSMGWVLYRQGDPREAVPYLRRAYQADPGPEIAAHLGEVLWQLGRREEAQQIWQRAREQAGDNEVLERTTQRLQP